MEANSRAALQRRLDTGTLTWRGPALMLFARHRGREAALSRAKLLTDLLRSDLGVSPEAATRALIDAKVPRKRTGR